MALSQYEKDKLAKKSASEVKKAQHQTDVIDVPVTDEKIFPKTPKQKWDNFWYHYKVHVIAGVLIVALVGSMVYSFVAKDKYDASLIIVSDVIFDGAEQHINKNISDILPDFDENGKSALGIVPIHMADPQTTPDVNPQSVMANQAKLIGTISNKENFLYMVDDYAYSQLEELGVQFMDLSSIVPSERIQGNKYSLAGSKLSELWNLNGLLNKQYLCLIDYSVFDNPSEKTEMLFNNEYEFMKRIMEYD